MKTVDYLLSALKHHGGRNDGFLTDQPVGVKLAEDDIVRVRYDAKAMRWIANRPSRIRELQKAVHPTGYTALTAIVTLPYVVALSQRLTALVQVGANF